METLAAQANIHAGDTVKLRTGIYVERFNLIGSTSPKGTSWDAPITYIADTGATPVIAPPAGQTPIYIHDSASTNWYIIFDGLTTLVDNDYGVFMDDGGSCLKFQHCIFSEPFDSNNATSGSCGIQIKGTSGIDYNDITISDCDISGFPG